jgi:hypothetical protein
VKLEHGQARALGHLDDLVEVRVDEYAHNLQPALQRRADLGRSRGIARPIFTFVLTPTIVDGGSGHDELLLVTARARPDLGGPVAKLHLHHPAS